MDLLKLENKIKKQPFLCHLGHTSGFMETRDGPINVITFICTSYKGCFVSSFMAITTFSTS